jgi:hypothetical protein
VAHNHAGAGSHPDWAINTIIEIVDNVVQLAAVDVRQHLFDLPVACQGAVGRVDQHGQ